MDGDIAVNYYQDRSTKWQLPESSRNTCVSIPIYHEDLDTMERVPTTWKKRTLFCQVSDLLGKLDTLHLVIYK